jgi:hypothetical protein
MTHSNKKATQNYSNEGGDKNPPPGKINSSHKLLVRKNRKNVVEEAEEPQTESDIHVFSLEDMELETDLENVFPNFDQPGDAIHHNPLMEITETKIFDKDESFVFQSTVFDNESKINYCKERCKK